MITPNPRKAAPCLLAALLLCACAGSGRAGAVEFARTAAQGRPAGCPETPVTYDLGRSGLVGGDALRCSFEDLGAADALQIRGVVLVEDALGAALRPLMESGVRVEVSGLTRLDRPSADRADKRVGDSSEARRLARTWQAEVGPQGRFEIMARGARPPFELRAIEVASGRVLARARADAGQIRRVDQKASAPGSPPNVWKQLRVELIIPATEEAQAAARAIAGQ